MSVNDTYTCDERSAGAARHTREATGLPNGGHAASSACQDLVAIGLVTHIPHNLHNADHHVTITSNKS